MAQLEARKIDEDRLSNEHNYEEYHTLRYEYLLNYARFHASNATRVLDIGRSPFLTLLEEAYPEVWTLGFPEAKELPRHIEFDLNLVAQGVGIPSEQYFDLVVFSEVVEHLHIPAYAVLMALRDLMHDNGILIVQTPNAAEIMKRVALLRGRNPYEQLRLNARNPGHFREYTMAEMREAAGKAGLRVREAHCLDYFPREIVRGFHPVRMVLDICRNFIPSFRSGQTLILEKV